MTQKQKALWVTTLISLSILAGCGKQPNEQAGDEQTTTPPALVSILPINPETVILTDELPGRVSAARVAEIRPQVGGIIEKRLFEEGADVEQGQPLFQIFAEPFQADVASAAAALQRTEAILIRAQGKLDRSTQLIKANAISREAFEDASAELAQAKASVAEAKATLSRRKLDLEFATVRAPISGRIGQALMSEGALVSAANSNALATIQQIDKVYVDVRQPASQIDVIRDAAVSGQLDDASRVPVAIFGASGKRYPVEGRALFSDISVDPGTGNVSTRVTVDNVDSLLLPGMYVRARLPRGVHHDALLVPQEAILRTPSGQAQLIVLDAKNHGSRRDVELSETVEGRTIVSSGLTSGETVVIQGQDRVQPDTPLEVIPFGKSQPLLQN